MLRKCAIVLLFACLALSAAAVDNEPNAATETEKAVDCNNDAAAHGTSTQYAEVVDLYSIKPRTDRGLRRAGRKYTRAPTVPRKLRVPTHANTPGIDKYESLLRYRNGVRAYGESLRTDSLAKRPEHWPKNRSEKVHGFLNTYDRARFGHPDAPYMVWSRASLKWEPNVEGITNHEFIKRRRQAMREYSARKRRLQVAQDHINAAQGGIAGRSSGALSRSADVLAQTTPNPSSPRSVPLIQGHVDPTKFAAYSVGLQPSPSPSQDASTCYGFYGCMDSPMGPVFTPSPYASLPSPQVPMSSWHEFPPIDEAQWHL